MAYGFEQKQAKIDDDVKLYLDENMHFEAWTMIIRHWEGDFDDLWEKLEQEFMKKTTTLTEEEMAEIAKMDMGHSEIINHFDPQIVKWLNSYKAN